MPAISEFLQYCTKKSTRQAYTSALCSYLRITLGLSVTKENLDELWNIYLFSGRNIMHDLQLFPEKCKNHNLSPKTINLYFQVTLLYLRECGLASDEAQLRRLKKIRPKNRPITREAELTREIIRTILVHADVRQRAEILIAASSGMRIGEILRITFDDINLTASPEEIYIPSHITKNETSRTVFISKEAAVALREWIFVRNGPHMLKGKEPAADNRIFPYSVTNETAKLNRLLQASGTYRIDPQTRRSLIHFHSFRKFFLTEFKLAASAEVAEELAGHTGYLSGSYRRLSKRDMQEEYRKAEMRLTIGENTGETTSDQITDIHEEMQRITNQLKQIRTEYQLLRTRISNESLLPEE
ncbi:tyrosine-type recombinase/integrase [Methanorbis furvi]|uniref:Tyr recombinase domain-containing protein n=1 Tax=Methanorbis furvi TaxID=3028299 RepID=A0AAE4MDH4_9EURY|nr:hypothetical protein [Methanocorpusculaceae archaeon Ag1]